MSVGRRVSAGVPLRKLAAFFLCSFLVLSLGYATLHGSLLLICDWLGPILGSPLTSALTVLYLLLADPLEFISIAALWLGVAFLGGVIIRRRVGAALTMLLVFILLLPALGLSAFELFQRASSLGLEVSGGNPLEVLPPLPEGLSVATFFEAPIIGKALETVMELIGEGPPEKMGFGLVMQVVQPLLLDLALKPVMILAAALLGVEAGRRIEPYFAPYSASLKASLGGGKSPSVANISTLGKRAALTITLILLSASAFAPLAGASEDDFYSEILVGLVDEGGRGYVGSLFVDSEMSLGGIDFQSPEAEGLLASVVISHRGVLERLPEVMNMTGLPEIEGLLGVLPPTVMVAVYLDVPIELAEQRADSFSAAFSDALDMDLHKLMAFIPPMPDELGEEMPAISLVLFQSSKDMEWMADDYLGQLTDHGGLIEVVQSASASGTLIPGGATGSADGSVLITGLVNPFPVLSRIEGVELSEVVEGVEVPAMLEDFLALLSGPFGLSGSLSFWEYGVEPEGDEYGFDILEILGYEEEASFSEDSDFSLIMVATPNETDPEGGAQGSVTMAFSQPLNETELEALYGNLPFGDSVELMAPGETLGSESHQASVAGIALPLKVEVSKVASPNSVRAGGTVQISVTVTNEDLKTMEEVVVEDGSAASGYPMSVEVVGGSTEMTWSRVPPGESRTMTYTLRLGEAGVYSLGLAQLGYTHSEGTFTGASGRLKVTVSRPNPGSFALSSVASWWTSAAEVLNVATRGSGYQILTAVTLLVLGTLLFLEVVNVRRWIRG
jgi:hypothetical protein